MAKWGKIIEIAKMIGWCLLAITGVIFLVMGIKWLVKKLPQEKTVEAAVKEIEKRKDQGKVFTANEFDYKSLADRFHQQLDWGIGNFDLGEFQKSVMKIKTYGDYLEVVKAYGVRSHNMIGGDFGLEGAVNHLKGSSETLGKVFFNTYLNGLKKHNQ